MSHNKLKPVLIIVALLAIAGVALLLIFKSGDGNDSDVLHLYGNVDVREVDLAFDNSEHIRELLVQEGDRVTKGQLLARLHRARLAASVAAAQANVASQKAALARLEAGSRPEEIRQARADVSSAQAQVADAETTYRRTVKLAAEDAAAEQAVDDARSGLAAARAELKVAEEALALAVQGPRVEDIDEARAQLAAREAELVLAREVLADADLYAPADGVIRNRLLEVGDMASPQKPVLSMALTDPVWVRAYLPETSLGKVAEGTPATVSTDSFPGKQYRGWVGYISPTAEFTPKNVETPDLRTRLVYQVRIYVCNPDNELRLGMPATVTIDVSHSPAERSLQSLDCTD
ncbi:MAG: efflux RND transporter periplasmic adaptor subunit [Gammaproteobacteria bacterium]|jgi:HlyD family secretion protein